MHPVDEYQNVLHGLLRQFMEFNSVTLATRFFYPLIDRHHTPASLLLPLLEKLPLSASKKLLTSKKTLSTPAYATLLRGLLTDFYAHRFLFQQPLKKTQLPGSRLSLNHWKKAFAQKDARRFSKTMRVIAPIRHPCIAGFFIHGSLATLDYEKNFSDFDSILIIKKNATSRDLAGLRKQLLRAYARMHAIDSAQHHGIPVLYEPEFGYYPEHYFPLGILASSVPVIPCSKPVFIRDDGAEKKAIFAKNQQFFERYTQKKPRWLSAYDFKLFVSKVLLLPTLFFQARGTPCLKKESFTRITKYLPSDVSGTLSFFSTLRRAWPSLFSFHFLDFFGNPFLPKLGTYLRLKHIPISVFTRAALLSKTLEEKL